MTPEDQAQAFEDELCALINRYADEFDLPAVTAIGILQVRIYLLTKEATERSGE